MDNTKPRDICIFKGLVKKEGPASCVYSAMITNFYRSDGKTLAPYELTLTENKRGSYHVNLSFSLRAGWESHIIPLRSKNLNDAVAEAKTRIFPIILRSEIELKIQDAQRSKKESIPPVSADILEFKFT